MVALHPELARIEQQYNQVIDDYEAGNLSYDDAFNTIRNLSVVDGAGWQWGINPDGDFTRAQPGGSPQLVDPVTFQQPQLPPRTSGGVVPPWAGNPDLLTPPQNASPIPAPGGGGTTGTGVFSPSAAVAPSPASEAAKTERVRSIHAPKRSLPGLPAGLSGLAGGMVGRNKKTFIVAGACLLLIVLVLLRHSSSPSTTQGLPQASPSASGAASLPNLPTVAPSAPAVPTTPSPDEVRALWSPLSSGQIETARKAVANVGTSNQAEIALGEFAGYKSVGLTLGCGPAATGEKGVIAMCTLVDIRSNQDVASATVTFTRSSGAWQFTEWPHFTAK